jgi:RNA polymerase sigma-B factor
LSQLEAAGLAPIPIPARALLVIAQHQAVSHRYLPLARYVARRYSGRGEPLEDLVQVASVALVRAIDRFDAERGAAFSSFAVPTVAGELKRHFRDRSWTVRPPRGPAASTGSHASSAGTRPRPRSPNAWRRRSRTSLTRAAATDRCRGASLDAPLAEDGYSLLEAIAAEDDGLERAEASADLAALMGALSARSREILRLRFAEDLSQAEVGKRVGLSQMHISRLERQAVAQLREQAKSRQQQVALARAA